MFSWIDFSGVKRQMYLQQINWRSWKIFTIRMWNWSKKNRPITLFTTILLNRRKFPNFLCWNCNIIRLPIIIIIIIIIILSCRHRWSRGNVIASRSKVRGFKPGWGRWIFQDVKLLNTSPHGETLSWESRVWDFRLVKESQDWKNRRLSKI